MRIEKSNLILEKNDIKVLWVSGLMFVGAMYAVGVFYSTQHLLAAVFG